MRGSSSYDRKSIHAQGCQRPSDTWEGQPGPVMRDQHLNRQHSMVAASIASAEHVNAIVADLGNRGWFGGFLVHAQKESTFRAGERITKLVLSDAVFPQWVRYRLWQ